MRGRKWWGRFRSWARHCVKLGTGDSHLPLPLPPRTHTLLGLLCGSNNSKSIVTLLDPPQGPHTRTLHSRHLKTDKSPLTWNSAPAPGKMGESMALVPHPCFPPFSLLGRTWSTVSCGWNLVVPGLPSSIACSHGEASALGRVSNPHPIEQEEATELSPLAMIPPHPPPFTIAFKLGLVPGRPPVFAPRQGLFGSKTHSEKEYLATDSAASSSLKSQSVTRLRKSRYL